MSWINQLLKTYEAVSRQGAFEEAEHPLIPAGFIEKRMGIMVTLSADGSFSGAERIEKNKGDSVMLPTTPEAESRTSSRLPPFPLFDSLVYLAGDFSDEGDGKLFDCYLRQLNEWADDSDAPSVLKIYRDYIARKTLIRDMQSYGLNIVPEKDEKQIVCFRILMGDGDSEKLWQRQDVRESWLKRSMAVRGNFKLCYVEGKESPILDSHPKLLGNAKLISSQDTGTIFQYKGRFTEPDEAVMVGYDASIKAHNTLLWLLNRQGYNRYGMQAVAWMTDGGEMDFPVKDERDDDEYSEEATAPQTFIDYGIRIRDMLYGHMRSLKGYDEKTLDEVNLIALETATPGRVSVIYYQELPGNEYVKRLTDWYRDCSWGFSRFVGDKDNRRSWRGISAPTPFEIASVVFGKRSAETARGDMRNEKSSTKAIRQLKLRLLHCMVDGAVLPEDVLGAAFHRVSAPLGFTDSNGKWQFHDWNLALSTYCALLHKRQTENNENEVIDVSLDKECKDRSYLYGRLLAVMDAAESRALGKDNYRETNAFRYMQLFQQRPFDTMVKLHTLILPYYRKLYDRAEWYKWQIAQIMELFEKGDYESALPLDGKFLQGYYCQRQELYQKKSKSPDSPDTDDDTNNLEG